MKRKVTIYTPAMVFVFEMHASAANQMVELYRIGRPFSYVHPPTHNEYHFRPELIVISVEIPS